jgi:hypothetical protein
LNTVLRQRLLPLLLAFLSSFLPTRDCAASGFRDLLTESLLHERHIEWGPISGDAPGVQYILGGNQDSLRLKIKCAGRLYAEGKARKLLFLHRPGITEFSPRLGRNYTNDEWASEQMAKEGIDAGDVEFIEVSSAVFSTLAEARAVSSLAGTRGFRRLILVTSRHHTARTWDSFSHCNRERRLDVYVYGTEEEPGLFELLLERLKLSVYRLVLFPIGRIGGGR